MKIVKNNQSNDLTFLHHREDFSGSLNIRFRQLGSEVNHDIALTANVVDCFTNVFSFDVLENELQNGTYGIEIINASEDILISATAYVEGFDEDNVRANIIIE